MEALIPYIIKSIITSGVLYAYYLVALRNKRFHAYNRFYLLTTVGISLLLPVFNFQYTIKEGQNIPFKAFIAVINPSYTKQSLIHFTIDWLLFSFMIIVSILLLVILASKIIWIYKVKRRSKNTRMSNFNFIETDTKEAPFTFLNNLFWKQGISATDPSGKKILNHELTHIRQRHTYDKLFTQLVLCLYWINPFYWLIQKELNMIHEFIADTTSIEEGDTESFALMLLQSYNEGRYLNPSNSFFNSPIKRRLTMITLSNNPRHSYLRRILVLPITLLVATAFSLTVKAQTDPKINPGPVNVNNVTVVKRTPDDSAIDVNINYNKSDGASGMLNLKNVKYTPGIHNTAEDNAVVKLDDGTVQTYTAEDVKKWVEFIIQNPPDLIYYLNGKETSKDNIKKLDPAKVKTANVLKDKEAVAKYGDKAATGVIIFTTE